MFAVSGWNLSAGPKTQVDTSAKKPRHKKKKSKSASGANAISVTEPAAGTRYSERHRDTNGRDATNVTANPGNGPQVTKDNVIALYERVIEGKDSKSHQKRERKKANGGQKDPASGAAQADSATAAMAKSKKRARPDDAVVAAGAGTPGDGIPSEKKKKVKKDKKKESAASVPVAMNNVLSPIPVASASTLTPLQQKMRAKLTSARFRHINETLYTTPSAASFTLFKEQPEMYHEYHSGFRRQVEVWPENPVDVFISLLSSRSKISFSRGHSKKQSSASSDVLPLPRDVSTGVCTIADLGCGDAKIAATFNHGKQHKKAKVNVLSYDLQASTPDVTPADISNLPLEPESVDVAIFCLALMGTNFLTFVDEAFRILRPRGELWVAEIKSRFNQPTKGDVKGDKDEAIVEELDEAGDRMRRKEVYNVFVKALEKRGFALRGQVDDANKMFVRMEFVKQGGTRVEEAGTETGTEKMKMQKKKKLKFLDGGDELTETKILKPCVYKLR